MKTYVKPSVNVIELQLNENIAAVPTTVFKGSTRESAVNQAQVFDLAMSTEGSGITNSNYKVS